MKNALCQASVISVVDYAVNYKGDIGKLLER